MVVVAAPLPPPPPLQYSIAKDRPRKILNLHREPSTYLEAVNCDDSGRWMIVM
ncbi:hypothetical protein CK203_060382 [Vitis vinifera]|uniref:Uncharacterized protein n=1 Tax=Vitis vinifera TaxID=29760 RepID=A0A438FSB9_VITVI|nr:hypothetical protein CK203_060382 [Vitis vinifera]